MRSRCQEVMNNKGGSTKIFKDYKSLIFSISQNNLQNEQCSVNNNLIGLNNQKQNISPLKKLHQFDQTNNDYFFNSLIQAGEGKGCGISQTSSFSQIELSMQVPQDHNYPKFQFKKQMISINNTNSHLLNQDSPIQNSTKNSDSDLDAHQCEAKKQASTNAFSNITIYKGPLIINQSSNSQESYSNFISQKSKEKLSCKQNQTSISLKKNNIQKTKMNNRIKSKKFSFRENEKQQVTTVIQNQTQEISSTNQEQTKYNSPLQNDCQTQVSVILSPYQYIKSRTLKDDFFLRQQNEQGQNDSQNTEKTFQAQKINDQIKQIPLFSYLPNQQNEIQIIKFSNLENSDLKSSTQQVSDQKQNQSFDSCENQQIGEEALKKHKNQLNEPEQIDSKNITAVNVNIPKESEKLVGIKQLSKLVKSSSK
ncbi:hypothetical protein ABPG72_021721 [Tetrahymena utriculariae]